MACENENMDPLPKTVLYNQRTHITKKSGISETIFEPVVRLVIFLYCYFESANHNLVFQIFSAYSINVLTL